MAEFLNPDNYEKNIIITYKTLGCPLEIQNKVRYNDVLKSDKPCVTINEKMIKIRPELYEMNRANGLKGNRLNIQYYEIKTESDRYGTGNIESSAFIISEENVQKGFGWLEDMNSISDMRLKEESVNVF